MSTDTPGMGARSAAHRALSETLRRKNPLDNALDDAISGHHLVARDSGFARAIANETMRRFGQLDDLVRHFVPQAPSPHRAGATLEILIAGACELLFLDVPAHAAVDGANRLAAADGKAVHFKPLINAALRRIAREGASILEKQDAQRLNTPDWLWTRWCETHGEETTRAIARVHAQTPPLDLVFPHTSVFPFPHGFPPPCAGEVPSPARWRGEADCVTPHSGPEFILGPAVGRSRGDHLPRTGRKDRERELPGGVVRFDHAGNVEALPGFGEGEFWVQDFAASLPARLFGNVRGRRVIDLCAAPGGKTAQLASGGAHVIAIERYEHRAARLAANLERLKLDAKLVIADARDYQPDRPAPCVLLDAPCSATGTIRRHPELPWIKQPGDIAACADAANELLDAAAEMVAADGILVFAVCSLEPEEGVEQVAHFLRRHTEFRRVPIMADELFGLAECISPDGDLRTLPSHLAESGGMDGFYAARLGRL
ncbi:MAG: RsmB/NOP family class I SAM-dependent RNA methyltransferase [Rhizomicrobium sp.]